MAHDGCERHADLHGYGRIQRTRKDYWEDALDYEIEQSDRDSDLCAKLHQRVGCAHVSGAVVADVYSGSKASGEIRGGNAAPQVGDYDEDAITECHIAAVALRAYRASTLDIGGPTVPGSGSSGLPSA